MSKPKLALVRPSARRMPAAPAPSSAAAARIDKGEARLVVQLPADVHQAVKRRAVDEGVSIREYIMRLLRDDGVIT